MKVILETGQLESADNIRHAAEIAIDDALAYLTLFERRFGAGSASAGNFRIGASGLFKELMTAAGA